MSQSNVVIRKLIAAMVEAKRTLPMRTRTGDNGEEPERDTLELVLGELIDVFTAALEPELEYPSHSQTIQGEVSQ
jgi:hypothetical protein